MMTALMISLAKLIMGLIHIGGPLIFLIALLHVRDHRKSTIEGIACKELNSPDLRWLVAVNTKCTLLSKRCTVEVDMWNCSNERIWDVIEGPRVNLPSSVRLVVKDGDGVSFLTLCPMHKDLNGDDVRCLKIFKSILSNQIKAMGHAIAVGVEPGGMSIAHYPLPHANEYGKII
jgi:hypothetical protein